jgi:hypothetical protein
VSQQLSIRRVLALLVLPASLFPVLMLSPSLVRAPATLWRRVDPPAPAHVVRVPPAPRPVPLLIGAARFEVDAFEPFAGRLTPRVGVSPLAPPARRVGIRSKRIPGPPGRLHPHRQVRIR